MDMKIGKSSYQFNQVFLQEAISVSGPKEEKGPLGKYFDYSFDTLEMGEASWEHAEIKMMKKALDLLFQKTNKTPTDIDLFIGGDLINQNVITNYSLRTYNVPVLGIYAACATSVLGLILASLLIDSGNMNQIITGTSSHYGDSERQYRNPTEYGGPKPLTQTVTVTGSGMALVGRKGDILIEGGTIGKVIDVGFDNAFDMGSAMAPAAFKTIQTFFEDFDLLPENYDCILTGDLSRIGSPILDDLLETHGYNIRVNHRDSGEMIYDANDNDIYQGGSGAGCLAITSYGYILKMMRDKKLNRVLLCGTGALLNPLIVNQKETVPSICHVISLRRI